MSEPKFLTEAIGKSLKLIDFKKKSDSWYLCSKETISVLNLQKSDYSRQYYMNVGVWLKCIGEVDFPKEYKCHIRFRWISLIPHDEKIMERLLNLEDKSISEADRLSEICILIEEFLFPFFSHAKTLDGLRKLFNSDNWPVSLVNIKAQDVLKRI